MAAARVGYKDGQFLLNPKVSQMEGSTLELVVAGTRDAVLMVESEAKELPENTMLEAVWFGHQQMQTAIAAIEDFAREAGRRSFEWTPAAPNTELQQAVREFAEKELVAAYGLADKSERTQRLQALRSAAHEALAPRFPEAPNHAIPNQLFALESEIVRLQALNTGRRIDGRDLTTVRPITIDLSFLPRAHGSAVFTRGETQAIVATTLGTERDSQIIDALEGEYRDSFMLHYNFPPYSVGETGMMGSPKRREIGHGNLAKRAIKAVLPDSGRFDYVLRVVSEITESNGSSSMATVCGTSLSLMDAGVPY